MNMIYRFVIRDFDSAYFDIPVKARLNLDNYMFIRFSSDKSSKIVLRFYKDIVCQGGKPSSNSLIEKTGFFDAGNEDWIDFESFNKSIVYDFSVRDYDLIVLTPNHVGYTHDINKSRIIDL